MTRLSTRSAVGAPPVWLAAAVMLLIPAAAFPCSCVPSRSPCSMIGTAEVVFVGTVTAVEGGGGRDGSGTVRFRFEIDKAIQNTDVKTADVLTPGDTAACGFPFQMGRKYLVYASGRGGVYSVSLCSRTGPLEERRDDLELLREAAEGTLRPRLFGTIYPMQLLVDGSFARYRALRGFADIPVLVADGGRVREARTDANGRFSIRDISPGRHIIQPQLPSRYTPLFERQAGATVDSCMGEVAMAVTTTPLRGTVHPANGEALVRQVMLRLAQVDSNGRVAADRSTLAFTEAGGAWKVQGLPAGRYVLGVSAFDPPSPDTPYPTTWHPNAARPDAARVFDVTDDGTISVDFQLPPRIPEVIFEGSTIAPDGSVVANVSLSLYDVESDNGQRRVAYATSDDRGSFTIRGLRGRRYRIQGMEARPGGGTSDMVDLTSYNNPRKVIVTIHPFTKSR